MQNINVIENLTRALSESIYERSEQLFKQIVNMVAQKILPLSINHDQIIANQFQSYNLKFQPNQRIKSPFSNETKFKKINKQLIAKKYLKQCAKNKISKLNKKIHQKYRKLNKLQQMKSDFINRKWNQDFLNFNSLKNKTKIQSPQMYKIGSKIQQQKVSTTSLKDPTEIKFQKIKQNFQNYLIIKQDRFKPDEFLCPICIQVLIDPVLTDCGHSFCFSCLQESLLLKDSCPVCRFNIKGTDLIPCNYLSMLIKIKYQNKKIAPKERQTYELRKKQNEEWRQKRFIKIQNIILDSTIDVKDPQSLWTSAKVIQIYYVNKNKSSVLVHYLNKDKEFDEVIEIKSQRLAPQGFFSQRSKPVGSNVTNNYLRGSVMLSSQSNLVPTNPPVNNSENRSRRVQSLLNAMNTMHHTINHRNQQIGPFRPDIIYRPNLQEMEVFQEEEQNNHQQIGQTEYVQEDLQNNELYYYQEVESQDHLSQYFYNQNNGDEMQQYQQDDQIQYLDYS